MSALTQLALMHGDAQLSEALRYGFEREGATVHNASDAGELEEALNKGAQVVITGFDDADEAQGALETIGEVMRGRQVERSVLYVGNGISREAALDAGATEFLGHPAYVRDVVTLAALLTERADPHRKSICGELSEHFGVFYLVRALSAVQRTGVLTLIRGLRRGELRFYEGEVTSAQMGLLHGLSALHQFLLWTNARFELRAESVVRRRQIPLSPTEVMADCERFLSEIRSISGPLSPSTVLDLVPDMDSSDLPKEVRQVYELFDGARTVADVIEDSPFRVFETLRIARRLLDKGYTQDSKRSVPKHLMHTALAIEEWLVGRDSSAQGSAPEASGPVGPAEGTPASPPTGDEGAKNPDKRPRTVSDGTPSVVDAGSDKSGWTDLLPSRSHEDLAQVVPATNAAGEISTSKKRPSERAASRVGDSEPEAPTAEHFETRAGSQSELSKIFVDESLGAQTLQQLGMVPDDFGGGSAEDEQTSPAKKVAIAASKDSQALADSMDSGVPQQIIDDGDATPPMAKTKRIKKKRKKKDRDTRKLQAIKPEEEPAEAEAEEPAAKGKEAGGVVQAVSGELKSGPLKVPQELQKEEASIVVDAGVSDSVSGAVSDPVSDAVDDSLDTPEEETSSEPTAAGASEKELAVVAKTASDALDAIRAAREAKLLVKSKRRPPSVNEEIQADAKKEVEELVASAETAASEAISFSAEEEAFFSRGVKEEAAPPPAIENFDDLDDEYEVPKTFWERLRSDPRKRRKRKK